MAGAVKLTHEVAITAPATQGGLTIDDLEQFCKTARDIGVDPLRGLDITITAGYSDPRESSPGSIKITARP